MSVELINSNKDTSEIDNNFTIIDWKKRNSSFMNALAVEKNVMFLILTLIIVVAAFNIISSMIMLVQTKKSDIALMRTMGASKFFIIRIFLFRLGWNFFSINLCAVRNLTVTDL